MRTFRGTLILRRAGKPRESWETEPSGRSIRLVHCLDTILDQILYISVLTDQGFPTCFWLVSPHIQVEKKHESVFTSHCLQVKRSVKTLFLNFEGQK